MMLLATFALLVFAFSLASRRLEATPITGPMVFTAAGVAAATAMSANHVSQLNGSIFLHLAEVGLVLLLFSDAMRTDLSELWSIRGLPTRLLAIGLPLTIALGAVAAWLILPGLHLWEAAILAAILSPTDAGLGQVIVRSPLVPLDVREALNVEAGLNDGLSVPFLLFFIALAAAAGEGMRASFSQFMVEQLAYGAAIGVAVGLAGGWLLGRAARLNWMSGVFRQLAVIMLPLLCLIASEAVGASMFIAAFVAGLAIQPGFKDAGKSGLQFAETGGQLLNLSVFFLFGMIVARNWHEIDLQIVVYAILSLTIVRIVPVAISLIGSGLGRSTVLFMGWFGPRGLASIVLGLVYLEQEVHLPGEATIRLTTIATVFLSIFAHGLSAHPGIARYAHGLADEGEPRPGPPQHP